MSEIVLWVYLDAPDVQRWRDTLGQADIDAWCAAHGWEADNVSLGSVIVARFDDGYQHVSCSVLQRDEGGRYRTNGDGFMRRLANSELRRSLPEGIGRVERA